MNLMLPAAGLGMSRQGQAVLLQEVFSSKCCWAYWNQLMAVVLKKKAQKSSGVGKSSSLTSQEQGRGWRCSELSPALP